LSTGNGDRDQQRDVAFERAFTAIAAVAVGGNPTAIGALAEQRAPLDPIRDFLLRDLPMDGLEEGADWRNYVCWQALLIDLLVLGTDPRGRAARAALHRCLGAIVIAFEQQQIARRLLDELAPQIRKGSHAA
jgi:hypothetical protein